MQIETKELAEIKSQVSGVQIAANNLSVNNQTDMDLATDLLHNVSKVEKLIIERKESVTKPLMKSLAAVRDLFKPLEIGYSEAKKTIKAKILAYTIEEDDRITKEKNRISARVERGTMRADTAAGKLEAVGEGPKSNIRTLKKVRIVDETIIPREWLEPSMTRITEAVLRQNMIIPGVEIFEERVIVAK